MDSNTFALFVLGFGTILVAVVIWQVFATAHARMSLNRTDDLEDATGRRYDEYRQLDQRLSALAEDVHAIEQRVTQLEPGAGQTARTDP